MESAEFRSYLALLRDLEAVLSQLTGIEQRKLQAVQHDELSTLNECMKQEQAITLRLRGYEQKQQTALKSMGLTGVPLSRLPEYAPEDCQAEAHETALSLRQQYEQFSAAFEVAQNTLECNLHTVEKVLSDLGASPSDGVGYQESGPELPRKMRTDFRA